MKVNFSLLHENSSISHTCYTSKFVNSSDQILEEYDAPKIQKCWMSQRIKKHNSATLRIR